MRDGLGKAIGTYPDRYDTTARQRAHNFSVWIFALVMDRLTSLMEFRCQHCGQRIVLTSLPATPEVGCPACGLLTRVPRPPVDSTAHRRANQENRPPPSSQRRRLRRIFEPIPRPFAYLVGASLVLIVLAPFWIYLIKERLDHHPPVLSDDAISIPMPTATETTPPPPAIEEPRAEVTNAIDEFLGIRLDANLEQLQRQFTLRLQNTRGMVPEIYEATQAGDIDSVTMHFYNNLLKEFWIDTRERRVTPDRIERELQETFGEPKDRALQPGTQGSERLGLGLTTGDARVMPGRGDKFARFPYRVGLSWSDGETHTEATIYYSWGKPEICVSVLTIHISAAQWLNNNRPQLGSVATTSPAAPTNTLDQTNEPPAPPPPPHRLFPSP
jgi:DNA-directed RNA polymerase subunit RPC12/RpoP